MNKDARWQDSLNLILGIWLVIAPIIGLGLMTGTAAWNSYVIGIAVIVFSGFALTRPEAWKEWINILLALWLVAGPFVLEFATRAISPAWNQVIVGLIIGIDAIWALLLPPPGKPTMS